MEFSTTSSGAEIARYSVGSRYKSGGEEKVSWFKIAAFDEGSKNYLHSLKKGFVFLNAYMHMQSLTIGEIELWCTLREL